MHGRVCEQRHQRRHMWPVPASTTVAADSASVSSDCFLKDGRKICVGDCALFEPPQDSPPFIGIIRRITGGKEEGLKLGVNWLYRPGDVKLGKGNFLEAAPNEIFYSFHKDEIPAASLLHPCKVAFLRKGVELPSGISSFVCRRVYDIENKCLWWLTDQDYVNERQEEVDQLLDKTRQEMHGAVPSGGRSPKPLNGPTSTPQLKPSADSVQNTTSSIASQVKGKKRERGDQGSDLIKRERLSKTDDGESGQFRPENMLRSEISKITEKEKGGLVDLEGVEKLVQLMQPDSAEKKIDLAGRIMLVDVIAVTDSCDCLGRFVQLRGLPVLDEWLQEVHKGKIGDGSSPKESDKAVEEFLLVLLRALDKLPVNLDALQTCNVGKSVNHLRSHKNAEIQRKARSLVDTWKKRVEAEMNMIDAKSGSTRGVSWPSKVVASEVSHVGSRRTGGSSDVGTKSSIIQPSASKTPPVKLSPVEAVAKFSPVALSGSTKSPASLTTSVASNSKDSNSKMNVGGGTSDLPLTTIKEEKSSSSSQSQNNSQSCSSDHAKTVGSSCREDARSSTAGSGSVNKLSGGASRHRKSSNGLSGSAVSGVQKETGLGKFSSSNRNLASEKASPTGVTYEKVPDMPVDHGNNQRLIVRFPNTGRSPARSASGGSFEDPAVTVCRSSPPPHTERNDHHDRKFKGKADGLRASITSNVNPELCQGKDELAGSDEAYGSPAAVERLRAGEDCEKPTEVLRTTGSPSGITPKAAKLYDASFSSINALIESCVKFSEASASASVGDDIGMNLLASVAAGEISKSEIVSPLGSPRRNSPVLGDSCSGSDAKLKQLDEDIAQSQGQPDDRANGGATADQDDTVDSSRAKNELRHPSTPMSANFSGDSKVNLFGCEEKIAEHRAQLNSSGADLQRNADSPCLSSDGKSQELVFDGSATLSSVDGTKEGNREGEQANQLHEQRKAGAVRAGSASVLDCKLEVRIPLVDEGKKVDSVDEKPVGNVEVLASEAAATSAKVKKEADEDSLSCSSSEMGGKDKNSTHNESTNGILLDQKPPPIVKIHSESERKSEVTGLLSGYGNIVGKDSKTEKADDTKSGNSVEQSEKQKMDLGSSVSDQKRECAEGNPERKEVLGHCSGGLFPHEESSTILLQGTEKCVKSSVCELAGVEADGMEEHATSVNVAVKLDFDLNEGFPGDDGNQGEVKLPVAGNSPAIHLPCPLPFPISSMSGSFPASVTIAAAAKGSFVPPENPLRTKGELGWKGSAATSAFRPAEPRKILEMPLSSTDIPLADTTAAKQGRLPLDIDLNVPDQRVLEDVPSQNSAQVTSSESGPRDRSAGGLDLDLNRADESPDMGQFTASNVCRSEIPSLPGRSSSSGGFSNGEVNVSRDFDLNNGPGPDEVGVEIAPRSHHGKSNLPFLSPVPGVRMNSPELGNFSSWFSPGNSYSAIAIPSILPGRGEQSYPLVAAAPGSQRILGPPTVGTSFGPEIYRAPVLSSSPAVPFPPATPFQYPGFPFETSFPLSSNSFSGCSTAYMDSTSGGPICFPAIPSQLVGPVGVVSSHYSRPYVMSLPGGTSNVGPESRKWGSQCLDLNAGPGTADVERREERVLSALRQLPVAGSQAMVDEQFKMYQVAGGVLKRKEPDGGWDADRCSYKQPSWK